jgi:hypothetical protein
MSHVSAVISDRIGTRAQKLTRLMAGEPTTRAQRFAKRMAGFDVPSFSALAAMPDWVLVDSPAERGRIANMAALLHFRQQIDRELDGAKLGAVAADLSEDLFDLACAAPLPPAPAMAAFEDNLPRPDIMIAMGEALLSRKDDPAATTLVNQAFELVVRS